MRTKRETRHTYLPSGSNSCLCSAVLIRALTNHIRYATVYLTLLVVKMDRGSESRSKQKDVGYFRFLLCCCPVQAEFCYDSPTNQILDESYFKTNLHTFRPASLKVVNLNNNN